MELDKRHGHRRKIGGGMTVVKFAAGIFALTYCALLAVMYFFQRDLQYFPSRGNPSPQSVGLSGVRVENLATSDGENVILWYAPAEPHKPTILFFHGNGGEIAGRAERFQFYQQQGFGVAFLSYRGYGGSTGRPTEAGLIMDAAAAYGWLVAQSIMPTSIVVIGESLGSGVAVQIAATKKIGALALEAPYSSTADVAAKVYWWLPVHFLMKDQFKSADVIRQVAVPLLVQHGDQDEIIPLEFGKKLFAAANEPKAMRVVSGAGHSELFVEATWAREVEFFARVIKR
jgi:uncharacterized protein